MTTAYDDALTEAAAVAVRFGAAMALFENALDKLSAATPHCDVCRWATDRGHSPRCSASDATTLAT